MHWRVFFFFYLFLSGITSKCKPRTCLVMGPSVKRSPTLQSQVRPTRPFSLQAYLLIRILPLSDAHAHFVHFSSLKWWRRSLFQMILFSSSVRLVSPLSGITFRGEANKWLSLVNKSTCLYFVCIRLCPISSSCSLSRFDYKQKKERKKREVHYFHPTTQLFLFFSFFLIHFFFNLYYCEKNNDLLIEWLMI